MASQDNGHRSKVLKVESKDQWDALLNQAKEQGSLIVAHFGASWCVTSITMNPYFEELASTYSDLKFVSVDVDDVMEVSSAMGVKAMPTFFMIKNGTAVDKIVGANPDELRRRIDIFIQSTGAHMA